MGIVVASKITSMRSGLSNKVVGQAGEFAVCSQLGKLGLIATPFAGNVPGFDVLAVDEYLNCVPIQVKTSSGKTWITGDLSKYVEVSMAGSVMSLGEIKPPRYPDLIRVYVSLGKAGKPDRFFILTESDFYQSAVESFRKWLESHGGVRPKNPDSMHSAVDISILEPHEDRWSLITDRLASLQESHKSSLNGGSQS